MRDGENLTHDCIEFLCLGCWLLRFHKLEVHIGFLDDAFQIIEA